LAFTEVGDRDCLVSDLKKRFSPWLFFKALQLELRETYVNVRALSARKSFEGLELARDLGTQNETEYFNAVFFRNAEKWCFLQINITGLGGLGRDWLTRKLETFILENRHG
jgi:hypothetical protein